MKYIIIIQNLNKILNFAKKQNKFFSKFKNLFF